MKLHASIDDRLRAFILDQPMFFVATAPRDPAGHVNVSPKGMRGTFAVLDGRRVAYLDYFGSGVETIAHLRDDGRITLMFCAFAGPPNIVRLYGTGTVLLPESDGYDAVIGHFAGAERHGSRAVIVVDIDRISDSCGYAVPVMEYVGDRDLLLQSHSRRDAAAFAEYRLTRNAASIDGLPGLP
jgi:hypothetical protein